MAGPIVVLVVEDDPLVRMNIVDALTQDGFTIYDAPNSSEALAAVSASVSVDCLLTDVDLGQGMNGLGLATQMRAAAPDLQVIVVSGQRHQMPAELPDARFFIKPYSTSKIAEAEREMVEARSGP
jgi:DNA-binding NtrC family response regulator